MQSTADSELARVQSVFALLYFYTSNSEAPYADQPID
jgi:hypothetical protein